MVHELTLVRSSLEDAFMALTADSVEYHATTEGAVAMTATLMESGTVVERTDVRRPGMGAVLRAEWIKLTTVRSTLVDAARDLRPRRRADRPAVLGATPTGWRRADADESPGSFITWGMMIAQITAVVLGALVVTTEYGTGMIRSTFAAVPARGRVLAAKSIVVVAVLFVVGTVTALVGYVGGNYFLDREGIGLALEGDVLRAMYGSGLYLAGHRPLHGRRRLPAPAHRRHDLDRPGADARSSATWSTWCPVSSASG